MSQEVTINNDAPVVNQPDLSVAHQPIANSTSYVAPYAPTQEAPKQESEAPKAPVVEKSIHDKMISDVDKFLSAKGVDPAEFRSFRAGQAPAPKAPAAMQEKPTAPAANLPSNPTMADLVEAISNKVVGEIESRRVVEETQARVYNEMQHFNNSMAGFIEATVSQIPAEQQTAAREALEKAIYEDIAEGVEILGENLNPEKGSVKPGAYTRLQKYLAKSLKSGAYGDKIRPFIPSTEERKVDAARAVLHPTAAAGIPQTEKSDDEKLMERMKQKVGTPISLLERPR